MSRSLLDVDHPDAPKRILCNFDSGLDTAEIAARFGVPEADVARLVAEALALRRRARADQGSRKYVRLAAAWDYEDVDRHEVARRFVFRDARAASGAVRQHRMLLREIAGTSA